jgi:putative two-component system response regulator
MLSPILIVDDEPTNLAVLRLILSPEHTLVFARSGSEALAMTAKHHPALILLDVMMPDMDGYTVCRQLKADPLTESIPVIFVTSLSTVSDETAGFAVGAVDYITKPVSPPIVKARVRTHLSLVSAKQLQQSYHEAIYMLGVASEFRDTDTGIHIWRMSAYSGALATAIGWDAGASRNLELAAMMHDIGKLGIPDSVLLKHGKLDSAEWKVIRSHTTVGHDILVKGSAEIFQLAATIALYHHERWDGGGYPSGLVGEAIPEVARIVAVADVFDALSMKRPYKEAWPVERVMETMTSSAGTHFEPRLIEHFVRILPDILEIEKHWDARETGKSLVPFRREPSL